MEEAYFIIVGASCLIAVINWRWGLYAGVLLDVLRDPVRKLSEEHSIIFTLLGASVWGVSLVMAILAHQGEWRQLFTRYRQFRLIGVCVPLAIAPAAALSVVLYNRGYLLAIIGIVSYLTPLFAIAMGFLFIRSENEVYRLFRLYCILNAVMMIGVPLESLGYDVPGLGGIDTIWVRHRGDQDDVMLISGWYRSPDIMGLHAAHVLLFSSMLAIRARAAGRIGWSTIAVWAIVCLMLCGRRKMIGIPAVFACSYFFLGVARGVFSTSRVVGFVVATAFIGVVVGIALSDTGVGDDYQEYTLYASTIATESHDRLNTLVLGSAIGTLQQVGVLGAGLGTATQGRYYANVQTSRATRGWQEDGLSKMLLEFGLPGLILMFVSGFALLAAMFQSLKFVDPHSSVQLLQIGMLSIVFGDMASFLISHQQFSGDPVSGMLVMLLVGCVLGAPRVYAAQQAARRRRMEQQNPVPAPRPGNANFPIRPLARPF